MPKVRIELNRRGVAALLTSPEMQADLDARARRIATAAGEGNEARSSQPRRRARASVVTTSAEAMRAEATNRALTRALDAGR